MIKDGQTLHVGGQYGPVSEPSVLYFTQIHPYGHEVEHEPTSHLLGLCGGCEGPVSYQQSATKCDHADGSE